MLDREVGAVHDMLPPKKVKRTSTTKLLEPSSFGLWQRWGSEIGECSSDRGRKQQAGLF